MPEYAMVCTILGLVSSLFDSLLGAVRNTTFISYDISNLARWTSGYGGKPILKDKFYIEHLLHQYHIGNMVNINTGNIEICKLSICWSCDMKKVKLRYCITTQLRTKTIWDFPVGSKASPC